MCGFVGLLDPFLEKEELGEVINSMTDRIFHRGPDKSGIYCENGIGLGFRRLSIIDLTNDGDQPMHSKCGRYVIIFNGEIYNYIELRDDLLKSGVIFTSNSDTEVLLELYKKMDVEMLHKLNGMFAFVIYDKNEKSLFIARDRLGIKPLFIYQKKEQLAFASEIKAFYSLKNFDSSINPESIKTYLRLGFVPTSESIYYNVFKLKPGHFIRFNIENVSKEHILENLKCYWSAKPSSKYKSNSFDQWVNIVDELLEDATRIRLRSDVPLAAFLSGGIDSSLVVAKAANLLGGNLKTLTFEVPGWSENEWPLAQLTAKQLGINAISRKIDQYSIKLLEELSGHFDEPFADTSMLPTFLISNEMKKHATVALSGDGGDEMFAGYRAHQVAEKMKALKYFPAIARKHALSFVASVLPNDGKMRRNLLRLTLSNNEYFAWLQKNLFEDWITRSLKPEFQISPSSIVKRLSEQFDNYSVSEPLDASQYADIKMILPDDMLVKVDRMSMKASMEVRSPFLDYRFTELAFTIPPHHRIRNGISKSILRELALRYLPSEIHNQPKRGFSIPMYDLLFKTSFGEQAIISLVKWASSDDNNCPITSSNMNKLLEHAKNNKALVSGIYRLLCLHYWFKNNLGHH